MDEPFAIWLLAALFFIILGACGIARVARGGVGVYDLAVYHSALCNTLHERFYFTWLYPEGCLFYQHFDPLALLLWPCYALWGNAAWPVLPLSMAFAAAALLPAIHAVGRSEGLSPRGALALPVLLALHPGLHNAAWYDFHPVVLALPLLAWGWHLLRIGRWWAGGVAWGAAALAKENVALTIAGLALGLFLMAPLGNPPPQPRAVALQRRAALVAMGLAVAWFVVVVGWIIPAFRELGTGNLYLSRYAWLGETPGRIAARLLGEPWTVAATVAGRADTWMLLGGLLLPLGLLPLLVPRLWPALLPELLVMLLADFQPMHTLRFHYQAVVLAPLAIAATVGWATLVRGEGVSFFPARAGGRPGWAAHRTLAVAILAVGGVAGLWWLKSEGRSLPFLDLPRKRDYYNRERRVREIAEVRALVPPTATVSLPHNLLNPVYGFIAQPLVAFLPDRVDQAEYVILDLQTGYFGGYKEPGLQELARRLAGSPSHQRLYERRGLLLYRRLGVLRMDPQALREAWRRGAAEAAE